MGFWGNTMAVLSFGEQIRKLRRRCRISLRAAAKELGVSPSYLSKIEQDKVPPPSMQIISKIADLFGVDRQDLVIKAPRRRTEELVGKLGRVSADAERYALYRIVEDIDDVEVLRALLEKAYEQMGKSGQDVEQDLDRLRAELPRLARGKEFLLAERCKPRCLCKADIEAMAAAVITDFLGEQDYEPPTPIEEIVEETRNTDLILSDEWDPRDESEDPNVLGLSRFSMKHARRKEIVVSARLFDSDEAHVRARLNFTLGHELFHVIEHLPRLAPGTKISLKRQITLSPQMNTSVVRPSRRQRRLRSWIENAKGPRRLTTDEDWREWQANYFAASLLMPREHLMREFEDRFGSEWLEAPDDMNLREYAWEVATTNVTPEYVCDETLSSLYAVSGQAMAIRLMQIGLVI